MWGTRQYRNEDEGFDCDMCSDWTLDDDIATCSCCENVFCSDCVNIECAGCKEKDDDECYVCESCVSYPGCKACSDDDLDFCTECIQDHLKNCNKSSRAQRIIHSEAYSIAQDEETMAGLRASIASQQARLRQLQQQVTASKERKASAEAAWTKEEDEEGPSKKQKTHRRKDSHHRRR